MRERDSIRCKDWESEKIVAAQAIATHDTNSNTAPLYLLRNLKKKMTGVDYHWNFCIFQYIPMGLGIRKPPVLVVVISFSCYVLMWCPHASNAQKRLVQQVLTRDGNLRLPHENFRYILQIPWTKRIHNSKKNDIRTVKLSVIKHNNIQYYKINNKNDIKLNCLGLLNLGCVWIPLILLKTENIVVK